jgi:hypothetical protein
MATDSYRHPEVSVDTSEFGFLGDSTAYHLRLPQPGELTWGDRHDMMSKLS